MALSKTRAEALAKAQDIFKKASLHPSYQAMHKKINEDFGFYDGTGQWKSIDLDKLKKREQDPITVNLCKGFIDNLSGVEIQSRYRTAVRSDSFRPEDDKLAEALTHLLFFIQEKESLPYKGSLKFRDALICGIGWSHLFQKDNGVCYDYVSPSNIIPDFDDLSPQFESMKFVCRKFWLTPEMISKRWAKQTAHLDLRHGKQEYYSSFSPEILDRRSAYADGNQIQEASRTLVVEVQYRQEAKFFQGMDTQGRSFETFDLELAEQLADNKKEIEEKQGERIMRVLFMDQTLLEFSPLDASFPNQKDFSYIPIVFQRRYGDGVCYGLLESLKDIQRDCNTRVTKSIYAINSSSLVFEGNPLPGMSMDKIKEELVKRDSVISLPRDSKFQLSSNAKLGEEQLKIVQLYLDLVQRVTGVSSEMLGLQTNATSGVAQHVRQVNSVRNNVFAFDSFSQMKKREAKAILDQIKNSGINNIAVEILTDQEREIFLFNITREIKGKTIVFNDIRTFPVSLYVEEVPDYQSSWAEEKGALESLLANQNAPWLMLSPELLTRLGFRNAEKLAKEMQTTMQMRSQMEQGQLPPGGSDQQPAGMPVDQLSPMMKSQSPL